MDMPSYGHVHPQATFVVSNCGAQQCMTSMGRRTSAAEVPTNGGWGLCLGSAIDNQLGGTYAPSQRELELADPTSNVMSLILLRHHSALPYQHCFSFPVGPRSSGKKPCDTEECHEVRTSNARASPSESAGPSWSDQGGQVGQVGVSKLRYGVGVAEAAAKKQRRVKQKRRRRRWRSWRREKSEAMSPFLSTRWRDCLS
ncbi:hypothetical protein BJV78DRAFT_560914 [Lactifluus subvellereus]|nr:hypothetical protein BJV78DRAFT_560914 [Lactifluus subvellereus]